MLWSNDPYKNLQVGWNAETHESFAYLAQLKESKARQDPRHQYRPVVTKTQAYLGCEQLYVNPQTDVTLMLAIAHEMISQKLYDDKFIQGYSLGFEKFVPYVMGTKDGVAKTPEWAAPICGVEAHVIRDLAKTLVKPHSVHDGLVHPAPATRRTTLLDGGGTGDHDRPNRATRWHQLWSPLLEYRRAFIRCRCAGAFPVTDENQSHSLMAQTSGARATHDSGCRWIDAFSNPAKPLMLTARKWFIDIKDDDFLG